MKKGCSKTLNKSQPKQEDAKAEHHNLHWRRGAQAEKYSYYWESNHAQASFTIEQPNWEEVHRTIWKPTANFNMRRESAETQANVWSRTGQWNHNGKPLPPRFPTRPATHPNPRPPVPYLHWTLQCHCMSIHRTDLSMTEQTNGLQCEELSTK